MHEIEGIIISCCMRVWKVDLDRNYGAEPMELLVWSGLQPPPFVCKTGLLYLSLSLCEQARFLAAAAAKSNYPPLAPISKVCECQTRLKVSLARPENLPAAAPPLYNAVSFPQLAESGGNVCNFCVHIVIRKRCLNLSTPRLCEKANNSYSGSVASVPVRPPTRWRIVRCLLCAA